MPNYTEMTTPVARLVFGNPFVVKTEKDEQTGIEYKFWKVSLSFPKTDQGFAKGSKQKEMFEFNMKGK